MATVAGKVPFFQLASLLDKICTIKKPDARKKLKDFVDEWRSFHNKLHADDANTVSTITI